MKLHIHYYLRTHTHVRKKTYVNVILSVITKLKEFSLLKLIGSHACTLTISRKRCTIKTLLMWNT